MKLIAILLVSCPLLLGQELAVRPGGNLRLDLMIHLVPSDSLPPLGSTGIRPKSPLRAAAYSVVVPGAGEFYAESYWRSAAFFGTEILLWVAYAVYDGKGDRQTTDFERYADQYWSVVRFAEWVETHGASLNPNPPPAGIVVSNDTNLPPWERVDWALLNAWEQHIGGRASTGFSHRLPRRPDQQYYELIGKYLQYNMGWDDWDPARVDYLTSMSQKFGYYRDMRGRANDLYTIARTAGYLVLANHFLSAVDAAFAASGFNKSVHIEARLRPTPRSFNFVEFVPTASVTVSF
ncbi:MAG: hypothetical protein WEB37_10750 [Bacteroidota bacterium]